MLKFIRLTDSEQIRFRIQSGLSKAEKNKVMSHLSNFYAIEKGNKLLCVEDSGEILLLNTAKKGSGSRHSISLANFDPMRHRKESKKPFGRSDARINAGIDPSQGGQIWLKTGKHFARGGENG